LKVALYCDSPDHTKSLDEVVKLTQVPRVGEFVLLKDQLYKVEEVVFVPKSKRPYDVALSLVEVDDESLPTNS
jgi:hypothetical protein